MRYSCMYVFKMMSVWTFVNVYVGTVFEEKNHTRTPHESEENVDPRVIEGRVGFLVRSAECENTLPPADTEDETNGERRQRECGARAGPLAAATVDPVSGKPGGGGNPAIQSRCLGVQRRRGRRLRLFRGAARLTRYGVTRRHRAARSGVDGSPRPSCAWAWRLSAGRLHFR